MKFLFENNGQLLELNLLLTSSATEEIASNAYDHDVGRLKVAQIYNQV